MVRKAQKRLFNFIGNNAKVDNTMVRKYIRDTSLNEKFKGTWVAEGLEDGATKGTVAKNHV